MKLGDVCKFINGDRGKNYPSQHDISNNGEVPFINAGHIVEGNIDLSAMNYISLEKYTQLNSGKIKENDILYCLRGSLGKKALVRNISVGAIASSLVIIRPDTEKANSEYLFYALESPTVQKQMLQANNGSSQPNLSAKSVSEYEFLLPNIKAQREVVAKMQHVNRLIVCRKKQLSKLDELIKARFVELFGDQESNPFGWEKSTIGECCTLKSGTSLSAEVENEGGSIPYVKVGDMNYPGNERYITTSSRYVSEETAGKGLFEVGSIIFPKRGGAIGTNKKRMTKLPICADLNVMGVSSNGKLLPAYLFAYFDLIDLGALSDGSSVPQINNKNIAPLVICVPPTELQNEFTSFVEQTDKSKLEVQKSLEKLELLKKALMQKYFG